MGRRWLLCVGQGCRVLAMAVVYGRGLRCVGGRCWWTAVLVYSAVAVDSSSAELVTISAGWGLIARSPYWRMVHINAVVDHG